MSRLVVVSNRVSKPEPNNHAAGGLAVGVQAALEDNHEMHDPAQPLEILRTIHSFDPCIACAVHVTDPEGEELVKVKIK